VNGIAERLAAVEARIVDAAQRSGRSPESVRLVAVSKTKPAQAIREAYAAGQRHFGENYVQELTAKAEELEDLPDLVLHFIGHLQRNKAKAAVRAASVIHTVDSVRLAEELGKRAAETERPAASAFAPLGEGGDARTAVFVEVNVGGETQKSGCAPNDVAAVLGAIEREPALRLVGLMTVPPFTEDPRGARLYFDALARLRDAHGGLGRLPELSMGMTHDLEEAIAAGATLVRVGTAIFGERG
jgi:pyridoxal phosphate enzyme (YggS family)